MDMKGWLHDQQAVLHEIDETAAVQEARIAATEAERAIEYARDIRPDGISPAAGTVGYVAVDPPFEGPGNRRDPWAQQELFDPSKPDLLFDYPVRPGINLSSPAGGPEVFAGFTDFDPTTTRVCVRCWSALGSLFCRECSAYMCGACVRKEHIEGPFATHVITVASSDLVRTSPVAVADMTQRSPAAVHMLGEERASAPEPAWSYLADLGEEHAAPEEGEVSFRGAQQSCDICQARFRRDTLDAAAFDLVYCCSQCDMVPCCVYCFEAGGRHHQHPSMKLDPDGVTVVRRDLLEAAERSMDDCIRKCFAVVNELEHLGHQTQSAMEEMRRRIRASCANLRTVMAQKYDNVGDDLKSLENWSTRDTEELARNNEIFRNYLALKLEQLDAVLALGDRNPTAGVNVWVHLFKHPGCGLMPLLSGQFQPLMDSPEPMTVPWNKLTCEEVRRLLHPCDSKTLSALDGLRAVNQQLGRQIHHIDVVGNLWKDSEAIEFPPSPAEYHQQKVNLIHSVLGDSELRDILLPLYDSYAADFHAEAEALVSGWVVPKGLRTHQQQQQLRKSGSGPSEAAAFDFAYKGPMLHTPEFLDVSVQLEGFLFRRDAFHQQWGLVRLALACDQFLLVSNVVRADTRRPLTLQTDPETQTLICLELPRLIENDQLVYLPPDSVVCLWGEEAEGIRCEVRHFIEPGISPLARMHQGAVKAGFECVRKQGDVALSYWLFGTDSAPAVHRWLTAVRDVIKGRQQHKDAPGVMVAAGGMIGMPTTSPALHPAQINVYCPPARPSHTRAAIHRYEDLIPEGRMATVSPDLVGLEHDEDERDVDNRERNPLRRQADYSRSALLGAHVFNPAREKLLRELRKSIEKKDDAEAERDKLERDNKLQEIVVKEPRLDTPRGQSESSSEKKTAVLSSVGHMSEVGDVPEDPTPTHEDSPPAQDAAAFVEDPEHGAVESEWTDETDSEPDKPEHSTPRAEVVRVAVRYPPSKTRMSE